MAKKTVDSSVSTKAAKYGNEASNIGETTGEDLMSVIRDTADMQMRYQSEMGLIQLATKMNEAVSKTLKASGEAIKGLAG